MTRVVTVADLADLDITGRDLMGRRHVGHR
jgi:hypothetical protein